MAKRWTEDDIRLLGKLFAAGVPDDEIAIRLSRSQSSIKLKRRKVGIVGDPHDRRISDISRSRMGNKRSGSKSHAWKGGRRLSSNGYIELRMPQHSRARGNGYVFEHIVVAEKKIGRSLLDNECVHHLDGIKTNNEIDNLEVITRSSHSSLHSKGKCMKLDKICPVCESIFKVKRSHFDKRKTCSKTCAAKTTLWRNHGK